MMAYTFPPSLHPLRDYLKGQGADTCAFVSARQAAFMAQQLLGTRVKFPDKGADMMPTLFLIQASMTNSNIREYRAPKEMRKPKKNRKGENLRMKPSFDAEAVKIGIHIFCDGASVPNPGVGGWGVVVYENGEETSSAFGGDPETTNNQMELAGLLNAIEKAKQLFGNSEQLVTIWCDSQYCVKGVNEWMPGWKAKGWQRAGANAEPKNRVVMNVEQWKAIDEALGESLQRSANISIRWVKGHHGVAGNERADQLAEQGRLEAEERGRSDDELSLLDQVNDLDTRFRQIMGAA